MCDYTLLDHQAPCSVGEVRSLREWRSLGELAVHRAHVAHGAAENPYGQTLSDIENTKPIIPHDFPAAEGTVIFWVFALNVMAIIHTICLRFSSMSANSRLHFEQF